MSKNTGNTETCIKCADRFGSIMDSQTKAIRAYRRVLKRILKEQGVAYSEMWRDYECYTCAKNWEEGEDEAHAGSCEIPKIHRVLDKYKEI